MAHGREKGKFLGAEVPCGGGEGDSGTSRLGQTLQAVRGCSAKMDLESGVVVLSDLSILDWNLTCCILKAERGGVANAPNKMRCDVALFLARLEPGRRDVVGWMRRGSTNLATPDLGRSGALSVFIFDVQIYSVVVTNV